jgi:hypothetical protein
MLPLLSKKFLDGVSPDSIVIDGTMCLSGGGRSDRAAILK